MSIRESELFPVERLREDFPIHERELGDVTLLVSLDDIGRNHIKRHEQ